MDARGLYLANERTGPGVTADASGLFPATYGPGDNTRSRNAPRPKKPGPSYWDMASQGLLSLPPSAFNSFNDFGAAGGLNALIGPLAPGSFPLQMALKFLPGLFDSGPKLPIDKAVPVAVVEVKDTAMDTFTLTNTRNAHSDTYSRRARMAIPIGRGRTG